MRRHEVSDDHYALIAPYLPHPSGKAGHPWHDHRVVLNGLFWKLHTGAQWRDMPTRYGPWQTIYDRYVRWRRDGTWDRILQALQVRLDANGQIDWAQWSIDSTSVRATRAAAGAAKKGESIAPSQRTMH